MTNILRLLQLPAGVQRLLAEGQIIAGHARALLGTPDRGFQEVLAKSVVAEGLTVRAVEELVRGHGEERASGSSRLRTRRRGAGPRRWERAAGAGQSARAPGACRHPGSSNWRSCCPITSTPG